jgi:YafQ family addiction module toxin component
MYSYELRKSVEKTFFKLAKRNPKQLEIIEKKIDEIVQDPHCYKNLRAPFQGFRRVHIDKSFVLLFSIDEKNKKVIVENYAHHDNIYKQ